jgi:hypothetical protein
MIWWTISRTHSKAFLNSGLKKVDDLVNHLQSSFEGFSELWVEESRWFSDPYPELVWWAFLNSGLKKVDDLVAHAQNSFEGFSELWIEDCVDDGIHTGVDVP